MGFLGIFRLIEDLLYEVMTWLVFYPRTLWSIIRHPLKAAEYSDGEQDDEASEQYNDMLSPPIFLMLTILIGHGIELGFHAESMKATGAIGRMINSSEESLLIFRLILFSVFPLMFALAIVKRSEMNLDRKTLRGPFFSQCYIAAVYSLMLSMAVIVSQVGGTEAVMYTAGCVFVANAWYLSVQTFILARTLNLPKIRGFGISVITLIKACLFSGAVTAIFLA